MVVQNQKPRNRFDSQTARLLQLLARLDGVANQLEPSREVFQKSHRIGVEYGHGLGRSQTQLGRNRLIPSSKNGSDKLDQRSQKTRQARHAERANHHDERTAKTHLTKRLRKGSFFYAKFKLEIRNEGTLEKCLEERGKKQEKRRRVL